MAQRVANPLIINTDSMQLYRDLDVVTARPSALDVAQVPHALYGTRDGAMGCSAQEWRDLVAEVLAQNPRCTPIFVGGTGLYFRALIDGLSPMPDVDETIRRDVRDRMLQVGPVPLHAELDRVMQEQLSPTDSQRVARALEVLLSTGKSLAHWQGLPPTGGLLDGFSATTVVLDPPRDWLEARIRQRGAAMLEVTAQQEVQALLARGLSPELPVMRAIGLSVVASFVRGERSEAEALDALTVQTRRYAKRQGTWFRGQMGDWPRLDPSRHAVDAMVDAMLNEGA